MPSVTPVDTPAKMRLNWSLKCRPKLLKRLARPDGFEPPTLGFEDRLLPLAFEPHLSSRGPEHLSIVGGVSPSGGGNEERAPRLKKKWDQLWDQKTRKQYQSDIA
jgi:hypothetical protein